MCTFSVHFPTPLLPSHPLAFFSSITQIKKLYSPHPQTPPVKISPPLPRNPPFWHPYTLPKTLPSWGNHTPRTILFHKGNSMIFEKNLNRAQSSQMRPPCIKRRCTSIKKRAYRIRAGIQNPPFTPSLPVEIISTFENRLESRGLGKKGGNAPMCKLSRGLSLNPRWGLGHIETEAH